MVDKMFGNALVYAQISKRLRREQVEIIWGKQRVAGW